MTQLETPIQPEVDTRPARSASSDSDHAWPFWWIALALTCVVAVVVAIVFVASVTSQPRLFKDAQVPVTVRDYKIVLPSSELSTGSKTLQITNGGGTPHELLVFQPASSIDPRHLPLDDEGNIVEDGPGVDLISDGDNIDPGQSQTRDLDLSKPGTYVFVCNLPGHYKLGMWSEVTVR